MSLPELKSTKKSFTTDTDGEAGSDKSASIPGEGQPVRRGLANVAYHRPRLSVGMPVYNGQRFLPLAIDSLLAQTFADFELILSDNASTDNTEQICRGYAARDPRIRYVRNQTNLGPLRNFLRAAELSSAEYFKWAAHDDLYAPEFLQRCLDVLERDPAVVVCYPRALIIDERGNVLQHRCYGIDTSSPRHIYPQERLRDVLWINLGVPPIFGVIRRSILDKTPLMQGSYAADQVLVAELALHGRFHEVPEELLLQREHPDRSVYIRPTRHSLATWWDPSQAGRLIFPTWRVLSDYVGGIWRAPLNWWQRLACAKHLFRWTLYHWRELLEDLTLPSRQAAVSENGIQHDES